MSALTDAELARYFRTDVEAADQAEEHRLRASHDRLLAAATAAHLDGSLATLPKVHFDAFVVAIAAAEEPTP